MMEKSTHCKIHILGDEYSLKSNESSEHVMQAANMVDTLVREIAGASSSIPEKKVAVLAALRLASMVLAAETALEQQRMKEQDLIEHIDKILLSS